jgi:hypothetical protein
MSKKIKLNTIALKDSFLIVVSPHNKSSFIEDCFIAGLNDLAALGLIEHDSIVYKQFANMIRSTPAMYARHCDYKMLDYVYKKIKLAEAFRLKNVTLRLGRTPNGLENLLALVHHFQDFAADVLQYTFNIMNDMTEQEKVKIVTRPEYGFVIWLTKKQGALAYTECNLMAAQTTNQEEAEALRGEGDDIWRSVERMVASLKANAKAV